MKIRTQLSLAFLLLAVLPLAGIVLYSYSSSLSAVRRAVEEEANAMTGEMEQRMAAIRSNLSYRFESMGPVSFATLLPDESAPGSGNLSSFEQGFVATMGDSAELFDSLEFIPAAPAPHPQVRVVTPDPPPPASSAKFLDQEAIVVDVRSILRELEASGDLSPADAQSVSAAIGAAVDIAAMTASGVLEGLSGLDVDFAGNSTDSSQEDLDARRARLEALSERIDVAQDAHEEALERVIAELDRAIEAGDEERQAELQEMLVELEDRVYEHLDEREEQLEERIERREETLAAEEDRLDEEAFVEERYERQWAEVGERLSARFKSWAMEWQSEHGGDPEATLATPRPAPDVSGETTGLLGKELDLPVQAQPGKIVGKVRALVSEEEIIRRVLVASEREQGEIPFAVDSAGTFYYANEDDQTIIESLDLEIGPETQIGEQIADSWVIATTADPETGLTYGIARPISESLAEIRSTAVRNFGWGMGLIGLALFGIVPLSSRMSRSVSTITEGAEKIAEGDLGARVPVRSRNELGRLAATFNRMATELEENRSRLLEEEQRRRENEVQQRLLEADVARKTAELEDARDFQLSLLPDELPAHASFDLAVSMQTATEVGGDFYDFMSGAEGELTIAIGDATGHGAKAGTMVTVIKSIFSTYTGTTSLDEFLEEAARVIHRMRLGRMSMALSLVRLQSGRLTLSAAGMPPLLLHRAATGEMVEVSTVGVPLGTLTEASYRRQEVDVESGDCLLLMTDGLPELLGENGEVFGYPRVEEAFSACADRPADEIVAELSRVASEWTGGQPPNDDITFVVVRVL